MIAVLDLLQHLGHSFRRQQFGGVGRWSAGRQLLLRQTKAEVHLGIITLAVVAFISLLLAMHTKLSPLLLETPFHHCVFCLLQTNTLVLIGFVLLMVGIYLSVACGIIGQAQGHTRVADRLHPVLAPQ